MKVVVAIITDEERRILITQRAPYASHGGMWEFPGGKLEPDESATSALIREVKEEVGIEVLEYAFLGEVSHVYSHQAVTLLVYHVSSHRGEAMCCEDQTDMRWVDIANLATFEFPEANHIIMGMLP